VTKACSIGLLSECGCDQIIKDQIAKDKWKWRGCSDDVSYASQFSKEFLDFNENLSTPEGLMNTHNNEAGRRVIIIICVYVVIC